MSLSAAEIALVVEIWNKLLKGAKVRGVVSPAEPDRIAIEMRTPGANHYLLISTSPRTARLCRIAEKPKAAERPHPFAMLLRSRLVGMSFDCASQTEGDRSVALDFSRREEKGRLVCELTSRHANLFWLGGDGLIAGSFYPNRSHRRKLVPGEPYDPPLAHPYAGAKEVRFFAGDDLEAEIEEHYRQIEENLESERIRNEAMRKAKAAALKLDRLIQKLEGDLGRAQEGERLAHLGELLKSNLRAAKKGSSTVEAIGPDGSVTLIPLDPSLSPAANMERLFSKAKRMRRAFPKIDERIEKARSSKRSFENLIAKIASADIATLTSIREQLDKRFKEPAKLTSKKGRASCERIPYREYPVAAGKRARVGRSARDNDALTLRFSKPDDLWLHVRGRAGSHVVVPLGRGEEPSSETLIDAAHLAAHFSEARGDESAEVTYTRRRYVVKPKGAAPGAVTLLREKTILLKIEEKRLWRLLKEN